MWKISGIEKEAQTADVKEEVEEEFGKTFNNSSTFKSQTNIGDAVDSEKSFNYLEEEVKEDQAMMCKCPDEVLQNNHSFTCSPHHNLRKFQRYLSTIDIRYESQQLLKQ